MGLIGVLDLPAQKEEAVVDSFPPQKEESMALMIISEMLPVISPRFPSSPLFPHNSNFSSKLFPSSRRRRSSSSSRRSRLLPPPPRSAVDRDEPTQRQFDRAEAREALQKLDQQLQSLELAQRPKTTRPSSPYSDPSLERDVITGMRSTEDMPEVSRSYLSYSAVALLILTIFNNIVFNFIIKPSVDGTERASPIERVPLNEP